MLIQESIFQSMQTTTPPKPRALSNEAIASFLEKRGWLRSVAGAVDFDRAVRGIVAARQQSCGLLFVGNAGVGKSAIMRILFNVCRSDRKVWLECTNPGHMSFVSANFRDYTDYDVFIDDLGVEEIARDYGNDHDAIGTLLHWLYERGTGRIFATTNLTSAQIDTKYGGRIYDRLTERCVVVPFEGKSKREKVIIK